LGKDHCHSLTRIADAVGGADVIALQEVRRNWPPDYADQPVEIGALLTKYYWVYGHSFDVGASRKTANGNVENHRRQFGTMLLSKTPIISARIHVFPKLAAVSHFNMDKGALEGVIQTPAGSVRFYSIHLSGLASRERVMQVNHFLKIHRRAWREGGAWCGPGNCGDAVWSAGELMPPMTQEAVVMGDFNSDKDTPEHELMASGWGSARLDYCYLSPSLAVKVKNAWVDNDALGSDHQPFWVELDFS
jgi:endonuclease/exonuclease/phosphatase family metal-dependent hydrolase